MRTLLLVLLLSTIAIRVRGVVEVSPDNSSWTPLIRNRTLTNWARTGPDSLGQVRTPDGLAILGPDTSVHLEEGGLRLEKGALRLQGGGKVLTRLGWVEAYGPYGTDAVLIDRGAEGYVCEVYEGWIRLQSPIEDVDEGERAVWTAKGVTRYDATLKDVPLDLRPPPED